MPEFAGWDSFYVIVGSAAGALIGLQFVVLFVGIHNAWDAVAYHVLVNRQTTKADDR